MTPCAAVGLLLLTVQAGCQLAVTSGQQTDARGVVPSVTAAPSAPPSDGGEWAALNTSAVEPPDEHQQQEKEEEVETEVLSERVPASWLRPLFVEPEPEPSGLEGRVPPLSGRPTPARTSVTTRRSPPKRRRVSWVTPFAVAKLDTTTLSADADVPDFGNFKLQPGVTATFSSPDFPDTYPPYLWNTLVFTTADSSGSLRVTCDTLELERGDYLLVRPNDGKLRVFTDSAGTADVTGRGKIQVEFRTNGSVGGLMRCSVRAARRAQAAPPSGQPAQPPSSTAASAPQQVDLNDKNCGRTKYAQRIVGGEEAPPHAYPWLVALERSRSKSPFCGASIINERFIMTAAHCVYGRSPKQLVVGVAKHKKSRDPDEKVHTVKKITIHEKYNRSTQDNDIAIIELQRSLRSLLADDNGWVGTVCLPTATCKDPATCFTARTAVLSGWGLLHPGDLHLPNSVQFVRVPVMTNADCQANYAKFRIGITGNMMCAGLPGGGKDSCQGDSGGPMAVVSDADVYTQVGVVSFGKGCALPGYPGVYTRVSEFTDWIRSKTRL